MANKRVATTELNHDNWNEDNDSEEAGTFVKASNDVLDKRILKTAKRRLSSRDETVSRSPFGSFTGFKTTPSTNSSPFSFLTDINATSSATTATSVTPVNTSKSIASNGSFKSPGNDANKKDTPKAQSLSSKTKSSKKSSIDQRDEKSGNNSSHYHAKLKGLNESVAQWIKTHVDANPFCILTPIFRDYEKYLKEIMSKEGHTKIQASHTPDKATQVVHIDKKKDISSEKKSSNFSFGNSNTDAKAPLSGTEWKSEKSIFSAVTTNTKSIFGNTEQKTESPQSVFSSTDTASDTRRSIFGINESSSPSKGIFSNTSNTEKNPFLNKSIVSDGKSNEEEVKSDAKPIASTFSSSTFSFGQGSTTSNMTAGFSFGGAKPFSFSAQAVKPQDSDEKTENENKDEDDEEPPKIEIKPVTEEGAIYEQRCKVFVKKDGNFSDRGVGMLFLKPTPNGKMQLIVRAETALGNLLLNTLLTQSIPTKRMNSNTIMLVCLPMPDSLPPPVPVLLRVKTSETADTLFETLNKHKK